LAWSTLFSTVCLGIICGVRKKWKEVKILSALRDIIWVAFILSILYYALYFSGLHSTSAGNASIIALTEVFSSFLFFHVWYKDYIPKEHILGSILMLVAAMVVLYPNLTEFKIGDILILIASFIVPVGNYFQQKARKKVSSEIILFIRNLIATPFLFAIVYIFKQDPTLSDLKQSIPFVLINGFIFLGCAKILWIESIHRISVTKANALSCINPIITLIFAWIMLNDIPTIWQMLSLIPIALGLIILGINKKPVRNDI
jgi:drug/metabolite transporter (DMT)-like permease